MANRPTFKSVYEEAEGDIRVRMLGRVSDAWRKEPGDFIYDAVAPSPLEVKQLQINQDDILKNSFAQYAEGDYLDLKVSELGLARAAATPNRRTLTITGDAAIAIPKGHKATSLVLDSNGNPIQFTIDNAIYFTANGAKEVEVTCMLLGTVGNIPNGSEFILSPPIAGIRKVVDGGTSIPGADPESDESLFERYQYKLQNPDTGGNRNNYVLWSNEVEGVGKAKCIPRWNGNGTVKVVLVGTDYLPATQAIVDAVQTHIDPKLKVIIPGGSISAQGDGTAVQNGAVILPYSDQEEGRAFYNEDLDVLLQTENHFTARFKVMVDAVEGTTNLLKLHVINRDTRAVLKKAVGSSDDAQVIVKASDLAATYGYVDVPFYWDGIQHVELEAVRLNTDEVTTVWLSEIDLVSTYGQALGAGKAPAGARVYVKAADALAINITANVVYTEGYAPAEVKEAFTTAVATYLKTVVFNEVPVVYARIGSALINTPGVSNYSSLLINGGTADIKQQPEEAATLGAVNI